MVEEVKHTVKVCWSGGKDSTCALMQHIMRGDKVNIVCYIPMFTKDIPLILKNHCEFLLKTANFFRSQGADVYIVTGETYVDRVTHRATKGKYEGLVLGFPYFNRGQCHFKRDSKLKAIKMCDVGHYDYEDIGIAFDEVDRHKQLSEKLRSILVELRITEDQAYQFCVANNLLSPHYGVNKRDGCTLCPNASHREREQWFMDYPEAIPIIKEVQRIVQIDKPYNFPLRGHSWFIDESGVIV